MKRFIIDGAEYTSSQLIALAPKTLKRRAIHNRLARGASTFKALFAEAKTRQRKDKQLYEILKADGTTFKSYRGGLEPFAKLAGISPATLDRRLSTGIRDYDFLFSPPTKKTNFVVPKNPTTVPGWIRWHMKRRNITIEVMAEKLHLNKSYVATYALGLKNAQPTSAHMLKRVCKILNLTKSERVALHRMAAIEAGWEIE